MGFILILQNPYIFLQRCLFGYAFIPTMSYKIILFASFYEIYGLAIFATLHRLQLAFSETKKTIKRESLENCIKVRTEILLHRW